MSSLTTNFADNVSTHWRSFRMAAWLGWQIKSNWADPFLFAIYSLVKPLAGAFILVVMYGVITDGDYNSPMFTYIFVGNAFYIYVGQIMNGISWSVVDDREHYKTLKYIYTAPVRYPSYLVGRGVAQFIIATISVTITLVIGVAFLHVAIDPMQVDWLLFLVTMLIGIVMLVSMGLILAGMMLLLAHHVWDLGAAIAGGMFLFSGAVFPLEVLPPFLRWIGYLLPITYWLELIRRALIGSTAEVYPTLANLSNLQLFGILVGLTLVTMIIASISFRSCEQKAKDRGMIDMVTNY